VCAIDGGCLEEFETATLGLCQRQDVQGLSGARDMASSRYHGCIYIADSLTTDVYRIDVSSGCESSRRHVVTSWSSDMHPVGLSITTQNNVLVAYQHSPVLREFSTDGRLLREMKLHMELVNPVCAVQLKAEHYVVCVTLPDDLSAICHVDGNGNVVSKYSGSKKWFCNGREDQYVHMAADGVVLVADANNNRILMTDPNLRGEPRTLINGLNGISCFAFDTENSRLFIVSNSYKNKGSNISVYSLI
jgi:hypothetical protein